MFENLAPGVEQESGGFCEVPLARSCDAAFVADAGPHRNLRILRVIVDFGAERCIVYRP